MNRQNTPRIWNAVQEKLRSDLDAVNYSKWISSLSATERPSANGPYEIVITAENQYTLRWINRNYKSLIEELITKELIGSSAGAPRIVFRCRSRAKPAAIAPRRAATSTSQRGNSRHKYEGQVDARNNFANLIIYEGNILAVKLAQDNLADLAKARHGDMPHHGGSIICASSGLGKTHMMHAIANELGAQDETIKVVYLTANKFVQVLVNSIATKTIDNLRSFYQSADLLLLDDIHFLTGKQKSQEEFLNLYNYFAAEGKTMILSCDVPPQALKGLNSQLRTRLAHSLLAPIAQPDLPARTKLVVASARKYNCALAEELAMLIAARIDRSVRDLEGAVKMVVYYANALKKPINEDLINDVLKDIAPVRAAKIDMKTIVKAVAEHQSVAAEDIRSNSRQSTIVLSRQLAMHLCRELTEHSTTEIGAYFGGRNHSAVIYSLSKFAAKQQRQSSLRNSCIEIKSRLIISS